MAIKIENYTGEKHADLEHQLFLAVESKQQFYLTFTKTGRGQNEFLKLLAVNGGASCQELLPNANQPLTIPWPLSLIVADIASRAHRVCVDAAREGEQWATVVLKSRGIDLLTQDQLEAVKNILKVLDSNAVVQGYAAGSGKTEKIRQDVHQEVADRLGISKEKAKMINFAAIYAGGQNPLAQPSDI